VGCQSKPFYPTFCDIVNVDLLECKPTDPALPQKDISTLEALTYRCISPEDWREAKKRLRRSLEIDDVFLPLLELD